MPTASRPPPGPRRGRRLTGRRTPRRHLGTPPSYRRRRPTATPLYPIVQHHLETFLARAAEADPWGEGVAGWVEDDFRAYLRCGILAHAFAGVRCDDCANERLVAFSCKGRGVCPSCNARRMVEVAAHLNDAVLPALPIRQWVVSVPQADPAPPSLPAPPGRSCRPGRQCRERWEAPQPSTIRPRAGRERLLRYCARPPFALDRLRIERDSGGRADDAGVGRVFYQPSRPTPDGRTLLALGPTRRRR